MFTVIYTFHVKPGMEELFQRSWAFITGEYLRTRGSLGSRLHRDKDGSYVAIALWPDRKTWETAAPNATQELEAARTTMREACQEVRTAHELEIVQDLWLRSTP